RIQRIIVAVISRDQCHLPPGQRLTLDLRLYLVVEYNDVRLQQELSIPEEDRTLQIEIKPQLEIIAAGGIHIHPAHIDRKGRTGSKHLQRIMRSAVRINSVVGTQRDLHFQYLAGGDQTIGQQRIRTITQLQKI